MHTYAFLHVFIDWIRGKKKYLLQPPRLLARPRRNHPRQPPLPAEPGDEETHQWPPAARLWRPCRRAEATRRRRSVCPRRSTPWCWSCSTHLAVRPARGTMPVPAQQPEPGSGDGDQYPRRPIRGLSAAAAAGSGALDSSSAPTTTTPATATPTIDEPPPPRRRRTDQAGVACCHAADDPPSITYTMPFSDLGIDHRHHLAYLTDLIGGARRETDRWRLSL